MLAAWLAGDPAAAAAATPGMVKVEMPGGGTVEARGVQPQGFLDAENFPVSPKSMKAYEALTSEFDRLARIAMQQQAAALQQQQQQGRVRQVGRGYTPLSTESIALHTQTHTRSESHCQGMTCAAAVDCRL
jgi:hypothetical protein